MKQQWLELIKGFQVIGGGGCSAVPVSKAPWPGVHQKEELVTSEVSRPPWGVTPHSVSSSTCEDPSPKPVFLPNLSKTQKGSWVSGLVRDAQVEEEGGCSLSFLPTWRGLKLTTGIPSTIQWLLIKGLRENTLPSPIHLLEMNSQHSNFLSIIFRNCELQQTKFWK